MASLNKIMLIGRLGKNPEMRYMQNSDPVCIFSLATSESWKDKDGGRQEKTEWHNIVMFRKLAEIAGEYLKQGSQVYLEGSVRTRKYQTKDGSQTRYITEVVADSMVMLDNKPHDGSNATTPQPARQQNSTPNNQQNDSDTGFDDIPDDIPF